MMTNMTVVVVLVLVEAGVFHCVIGGDHSD